MGKMRRRRKEREFGLKAHRDVASAELSDPRLERARLDALLKECEDGPATWREWDEAKRQKAERKDGEGQCRQDG
jgi:hypothetical protein